VTAVQKDLRLTFWLASGPSPTNAFAMEKPDQLRELFRKQKALNERIGVKTDGMNEAERTKWILTYCRAMTQEIAELTDSVPWKWWAKYQKFDEQNARVEVVDLFHFSHQPGAGARDERRRRVCRLSQKERREFPAAGKRLHGQR
jgi:dUTPase-like protein